jgi:hypothetical protein
LDRVVGARWLVRLAHRAALLRSFSRSKGSRVRSWPATMAAANKKLARSNKTRTVAAYGPVRMPCAGRRMQSRRGLNHEQPRRAPRQCRPRGRTRSGVEFPERGKTGMRPEAAVVPGAHTSCRRFPGVGTCIVPNERRAPEISAQPVPGAARSVKPE